MSLSSLIKYTTENIRLDMLRRVVHWPADIILKHAPGLGVVVNTSLYISSDFSLTVLLFSLVDMEHI